MIGDVHSYSIRLEGIRFRGRHGASKAERDLPQDFVVDIEVCLPVSELPKEDARQLVYDYDHVANLVVDEGTKHSYKLLETLGKRLIERLLAETPAISTVVRVRKFGPPTTSSVESVSIELQGRRSS